MKHEKLHLAKNIMLLIQLSEDFLLFSYYFRHEKTRFLAWISTSSLVIDENDEVYLNNWINVLFLFEKEILTELFNAFIYFKMST